MSTTFDTTEDPWVAFRAALPRAVTDSLRDTQMAVALLHTAVRDQGWAPKQLAVECSRDLKDVRNPGAIVTDRLRRAAQHPPVNTTAGTSTGGDRLRFCSQECWINRGWELDPKTMLPVRHCKCRRERET